MAQAGVMMKKHTGGCHCGAVRFEVALDLDATANRCNCSVCTKTNMTSMIVKPAAFALVAGAANLSVYEWGSKIAKRYFCRTCGVHCYAPGYLEEIGGDYVSINLNALDDIEPSALALQHWDGRHNNWDAGPRPTPYPIRA
jgi:hypothetical protein